MESQKRRNVEHLFERLRIDNVLQYVADQYRDFRYLILMWWLQRECGNVADHLFGNVEHPGYQDSKQTGPKIDQGSQYVMLKCLTSRFQSNCILFRILTDQGLDFKFLRSYFLDNNF